LPAAYDMDVIDRRIAERGHLLDGFPGLRFKAYLSARKGKLDSRENLYAPFYLWAQEEGLTEFVCGPGFAGLSGDFGRPSIRTWVVWSGETHHDLREARFALRENEPI